MMKQLAKVAALVLVLTGCVMRAPTSALSDSLATPVDELARGLAANPDTAEAVFQPAVDIIVIWQSAQ